MAMVMKSWHGVVVCVMVVALVAMTHGVPCRKITKSLLQCETDSSVQTIGCDDVGARIRVQTAIVAQHQYLGCMTSTYHSCQVQDFTDNVRMLCDDRDSCDILVQNYVRNLVGCQDPSVHQGKMSIYVTYTCHVPVEQYPTLGMCNNHIYDGPSRVVIRGELHPDDDCKCRLYYWPQAEMEVESVNFEETFGRTCSRNVIMLRDLTISTETGYLCGDEDTKFSCEAVHHEARRRFSFEPDLSDYEVFRSYDIITTGVDGLNMTVVCGTEEYVDTTVRSFSTTQRPVATSKLPTLPSSTTKPTTAQPDRPTTETEEEETTTPSTTETPTTTPPTTTEPPTTTPATTEAPTTVAPTTVAPTTVAPTTVAPTTPEATTTPPTTTVEQTTAAAPTTTPTRTTAPPAPEETTQPPTDESRTTTAVQGGAVTTLSPPHTDAPTTATSNDTDAYGAKSSSGDDGMPPELIIGICAGGGCLIIILIVIGVTRNMRQEKLSKSREALSDGADDRSVYDEPNEDEMYSNKYYGAPPGTPGAGPGTSYYLAGATPPSTAPRHHTDTAQSGAAAMRGSSSPFHGGPRGGGPRGGGARGGGGGGGRHATSSPIDEARQRQSYREMNDQSEVEIQVQTNPMFGQTDVFNTLPGGFAY